MIHSPRPNSIALTDALADGVPDSCRNEAGNEPGDCRREDSRWARDEALKKTLRGSCAVDGANEAQIMHNAS